jgi:cell division control protein 7
VIHRDVKPSNILFNPDDGHLVLVDFGFAHHEAKFGALPENPGVARDIANPGAAAIGRMPMPGSRAGTRGFRAPEVLAGAVNQTTAIDVWAAGVIFLSLLTQRYPFFVGEDDLTNLCQVATIVGGRRLQEAMAECDRVVRLPRFVPEEALKLGDLVLALNPIGREGRTCAAAIGLLERMLEPSPSRRILARDGLTHPFLR